MIKIYRKKLNDLQLKKVDKIEKGCWISVLEPSEKEIRSLAEFLGLDLIMFFAIIKKKRWI